MRVLDIGEKTGISQRRRGGGVRRGRIETASLRSLPLGGLLRGIYSGRKVGERKAESGKPDEKRDFQTNGMQGREKYAASRGIHPKEVCCAEFRIGEVAVKK